MRQPQREATCLFRDHLSLKTSQLGFLHITATYMRTCHTFTSPCAERPPVSGDQSCQDPNYAATYTSLCIERPCILQVLYSIRIAVARVTGPTRQRNMLASHRAVAGAS
eukprot:scpid109808/ scgid13239/ 